MTAVNGGFGAAIACVLIAHSTVLVGEPESSPAHPNAPAPSARFARLGFETAPASALATLASSDLTEWRDLAPHENAASEAQSAAAPSVARFGKLGFDTDPATAIASLAPLLEAPTMASSSPNGTANPEALREPAGRSTVPVAEKSQERRLADADNPEPPSWADRYSVTDAGRSVLNASFEVLPASWTAPTTAPTFDFEAAQPARLILAAQNATPAPTALPSTPVGEAPEMMEPAAEVAALPEGARVLTPTGRLVVETSYEYALTSSNRLVFRGVEIVPGILLGLIDANDVVRDTVVAALNVRYGIMDRMEIEARIPVVYRHDRFTVLSQQVSPTIPAATQVFDLKGQDLGDIEFGLRYQLNRARTGGAIFVGGIRAKMRTGIGPYDVEYDDNGVATSLGTGSGFWAVEPNLTMLYPSDPVVIFMNVGYIHSFGLNIDKDIGTAHIGQVDPGGAIHASIGFGFALNPEFSFSLGFTNTFIFGTDSEIGALTTRSNSLESASLTMGLSYVFSPNFTIGGNFEFGVTEDAPDMRVLLRLPFRF
jgi:hypothetical protein